MVMRVHPIFRDARAHFRIQVSTRQALACLGSGSSKTPSPCDGVFCVKGGAGGGWHSWPA
jgi:hypothetical protein